MVYGKRKWFAVSGALLFACGAMASVIPVGTGSNHAEVYIEFGDGATYGFDVFFDGTPTGMGLLDIIEAHQPLTTVRPFGGMFVDGMSYDGHSSIGYNGGENWWHYWIREPGSDWFAPQTYGATDRVAQDGSADGWIYGRLGAPVPEPTTAALVAMALIMVGAKKAVSH